MLEFLAAKANLPFTVALALMFFIAMLEGVGTLLGLGVSSLLDSIAPDIDTDVDAEIDSASGLSRFLGWLQFGKVPVLVLLIVFLTSFGLIGLVLQSVMHDWFGRFLPAIVASVPAFFLALPVVRSLGGVVAKIFPQDETEAVSDKSFIGRVAVITLGTASSGSAAEARLQDQHGQTHYVMVVPDQADASFDQGTEVLLVKKMGSQFAAIRNTHEVLSRNK